MPHFLLITYLKQIYLLLFVYICTPLCIYVYHVCAGALRGQRSNHPLERELETVVSCLMWVLGTEPGSFARAVSALTRLSSPEVFIFNTWTLRSDANPVSRTCNFLKSWSQY